MSREVATKESVSAARQHLLSRGITPTQRNVLEITGGSISTVNRFMKELDEEGRDMLGPGDRTQERLGALVKALHAELQLQAKETITRAAAENEKLLDKANGDLEAVQQDYDALKAQLTEVDQKCEYQADECAKVIGENNRANTEIAAQARSLAHTEQARVLLETRASKLERDLTRSQDAFIAYQDLMGENRRRDQGTFNSALEGIRLELRESGNQLSSANLAHQDTTARNLVLNRDAERLSSEVGNLTEKVHELQDSLRNERILLDSARQAETAQKIATGRAQGQIILLSKQLEEATSLRSSVEIKVRALEKELRAHKLAGEAHRPKNTAPQLSETQQQPKEVNEP